MFTMFIRSALQCWLRVADAKIGLQIHGGDAGLTLYSRKYVSRKEGCLRSCDDPGSQFPHGTGASLWEPLSCRRIILLVMRSRLAFTLSMQRLR